MCGGRHGRRQRGCRPRGGTGVDYTLNGIAFKTLTASIEKVKVATRTGFQRMGMKKTKDQKSEKGWDLEATANERATPSIIPIGRSGRRPSGAEYATAGSDVLLVEVATQVITDIIRNVAR